MSDLVNKSFEIDIKTKIKFGLNLRFEIGKILKNKNYKKVLICTDKNIVKLKYINEIFNSISDEKIYYKIYDGVEVNPTITTIVDAYNKFKKDSFNCIIGIGGGGPIDVAKGISIALTHKGNIRDYIAEVNGQKKPILDIVLPVIAIPTTAGSGAEVSPVSVIVDEKRKLKIGFFSEYLFPVISLVDPVLYTTLPPKVTAGCGLDVLSHSFDAFVSPYSNSYSDALAIKSIEMVFNNLKTAVFNGKNLESRAEMAIASILGLISMYIGKGGSTHTIGEPLGGLYNISHGYACGIAIPAVMEFLLPVCRDKFITIFKNISNFFDPRENNSVVAHECIEEFRKLIIDIKVEKPLKVVNNPDIELLSEYSIKHLAVNRIPGVATKSDFVNLYKKIFNKNYF